jgi:hypothetical protein
VSGLIVRAFGSTDLRVIIDSGNLHSDFSSFDPANGISIKGSVWGWREIPLMDDGTKGDETSDDGRFTERPGKLARRLAQSPRVASWICLRRSQVVGRTGTAEFVGKACRCTLTGP